MQDEYMDRETTPIGITNYRNSNLLFGIKDTDRLAHIFCLGKTGVGKSTLLVNMAISDIENGKGLAVIDPHSDVAETLINNIPDHRKNDLIYFNPSHLDSGIHFNPLHAVHPHFHHLVASGLVSVFKKIWGETSWGPRMEYILRFVILTLLEYPEATFLDIQPLLTSTLHRDMILAYVKNDATISFWQNEFLKYSPTMRAEAVAPILNKTGLFLTSIPLRNMVGHTTSSFRMQQVLDDGKILICNLSKGLIGEDACTLLGSMLVTSIQLSALFRASQHVSERRPFYLFIDESQTFATHSFCDMLSEARKYGLGVFMANQFLDQLNEKIRAAIFGNCGTIISFRVGGTDAEILAKEFFPVFEAIDFVHLPRYSMYLKLMIDGASSQPFSAFSCLTTRIRL